MEAKEQKIRLNPRKVFWQRGACSSAMFYLLNHEFDNVKLQEEKAAEMLAGGIAQKGHQCGMLWGGALGIGNESFRRYDDKNMAVAVSINASRQLVDSFKKRARYVNCRDITNVNMENKWGLTLFTLKTITCGFVFSPCFNLIVKWTPEAVQAAKNGLAENVTFNQPCISCATEVVRKMGGTEEESIMVAGLAGGIGLSGNACGALGAAVWYKMLEWGKKNPGQTQIMFDNPDAKKVIRTFYMQTDSEVLCSKICNKKFNTIDEHSEYIKNGVCKNIIEALANTSFLKKEKSLPPLLNILQ